MYQEWSASQVAHAGYSVGTGGWPGGSTGGWPGGSSTAPLLAKGHRDGCDVTVLEAPKAHCHQLVVDAFCAVFAAANGHFGVGDNVASIRALLVTGKAEELVVSRKAEELVVSGKAEELGSADDGPGAVGEFGVLGSVADATSRPRDNSGLSERWRTESMNVVKNRVVAPSVLTDRQSVLMAGRKCGTFLR